MVNPHAHPLEEAPPEIIKLANELTNLNNGKPVNYLSLIAYEDKRDHINWHQHNEDRCRDATVFIISLGETRTFGIRRVCEKHRLCDECNSSCHESKKTLCKECKKKMRQRRGCSAKCKKNHIHFKRCKICQDSPKQWTSLQPKHGSVIVLPDQYNLTHEHAILGAGDVGGDKKEKTLRISINTKNIRPEDALYIEREHRGPGVIPSGPLRAPQIEPDAAAENSPVEPKTEVVHCKRDAFDVYIGKRNVKGNMPESPFANRSGGDYESYFLMKLNNVPTFAARVMNCHGKRLGCWCSGTSRDSSKCHGHIVAKWADRIHDKWQELKPDKIKMREWLRQATKEGSK